MKKELWKVEETLTALVCTLRAAAIPCEIILVDDGSTDATALRVPACAARHPKVRLVQHRGRHSFGMTVRCGLQAVRSEAVAIVMPNGSDSPEDVVTC